MVAVGLAWFVQDLTHVTSPLAFALGDFFYVGYFGAGGGFLVMSLFGICGIHDVHEMNALKVLTAAVSIGIPAITFIMARRVEWQFCLQMAVLAGIGGYLAAHYSRRVNQRAMRWAVASIGLLTAGYFFLQNYRHA